MLRVVLLSALFVSAAAAAQNAQEVREMRPCLDTRAWPTDQVTFGLEVPFNVIVWLPPIDPSFAYNICRRDFVNGGQTTRCIRLLPVEDLEPLPWVAAGNPRTGAPINAHELERDQVTLDDEAWQELLRGGCWDIQALGPNGPIDFLGNLCPSGPADTEAPTEPGLSAFLERPVWGTGSPNSNSDMEPIDHSCNPLASQAGSGQLRLHLRSEEIGTSLIHVQVFSGDEMLLDMARPMADRLVLNVDIGSRSPDSLRAQARIIDFAGQFSAWSEATEVIDERVAGCDCTAGDPWGLGLLALGLLRLRRRRHHGL